MANAPINVGQYRIFITLIALPVHEAYFGTRQLRYYGLGNI